MQNLFRFFDKDDNGLINRKELRQVLECLEDPKFTNKELDAFIRKVDRDGDGLINYEGNIYVIIWLIAIILYFLLFQSANTTK